MVRSFCYRRSIWSDKTGRRPLLKSEAKAPLGAQGRETEESPHFSRGECQYFLSIPTVLNNGFKNGPRFMH